MKNTTYKKTNKTKSKFRYVLDIDENPENPFTFSDTGVSFLVDKENRYFGGLATSDAPDTPDSEEWAFVFPLYGYVHSGQAVSLSPFSCSWDSGQIGFVGITKENLSGIFGKDTNEEKAKEIVQSNLDALNAYLSGDCWFIAIQRKVCEECDTWETLDKVFGFYGKGYAEAEAITMLKWYEKQTLDT